MPASVLTSFQGTAKAFQQSMQGMGFLLLGADSRRLYRARHPV